MGPVWLSLTGNSGGVRVFLGGPKQIQGLELIRWLLSKMWPIVVVRNGATVHAGLVFGCAAGVWCGGQLCFLVFGTGGARRWSGGSRVAFIDMAILDIEGLGEF